MRFLTAIPARSEPELKANLERLGDALGMVRGGAVPRLVIGGYEERARGGDVVFVSATLPGSGEDLLWNIREALNALGRMWGAVLKDEPLPSCMGPGMSYRPEPLEYPLEEWADPYTASARGWGDCDDLVIWRIGELAAKGRDAWAQTMWRRGTEDYHVAVRLDSGAEEDPALYLSKRSEG